MGTKPTGEQASRIWKKIGDIQRQIYLQQDGYPHDLEALDTALQDIVEGKFGNEKVVGNTTADINWHAVYEKLGLLRNPNSSSQRTSPAKRAPTKTPGTYPS